MVSYNMGIQMKTSEARIIIYLNTVHSKHKFSRKIAAKLDIDYAYILQILYNMHEKKWITKDRYALKTYYILTGKAPIQAAREQLKKRT